MNFVKSVRLEVILIKIISLLLGLVLTNGFQCLLGKEAHYKHIGKENVVKIKKMYTQSEYLCPHQTRTGQ